MEGEDPMSCAEGQCEVSPEKSWRGTKVRFKTVPVGVIFRTFYAEYDAHEWLKEAPFQKDGESFNAKLWMQWNYGSGAPRQKWFDSNDMVYTDWNS